MQVSAGTISFDNQASPSFGAQWGEQCSPNVMLGAATRGENATAQGTAAPEERLGTPEVNLPALWQSLGGKYNGFSADLNMTEVYMRSDGSEQCWQFLSVSATVTTFEGKGYIGH